MRIASVRSAAFAASLLGLFSFTSSARALTPVHHWSKGMGGAGNDLPTAVATDAAGNVIMAGVFNGTINLGGSNLVSAGTDDIFIVKYNSAGVHQWSLRAGGTNQDQAYDVTTDPFGDIYVAGLFGSSTLTFGPITISNRGANDGFVVKLLPDGSTLWVLQVGGTGSDNVIGVRVDYPLNMYIAGSFSGTCEFGTFSTSLQQTAVGSTDIYVANYHVAGSSATINWAGGYGGTGSEAVQGFGRDSSDNLYVAGTFAGSSNLGGGAVTSVGGSNDGFLASYNSSGAYRWSKVYGGPGLDLANSVVSTSTGDVVVTGRFTGSVNFGGGSITSYGGTDAFLARYTGAGAHVWSEKLGGTLEDYGTSVAIDAADNLTLAGYFDGTTNVGGGPLVSAGTEDVFLARYNAGGVNLWSQRFGGAGADWSNAVTVDPFGSVILTGTFQGTSGFGGSLFTSNGGSRDIFIAHYGGWPAEPVVRSVVDAGNDQGRNVTLDISPSGWDAASSATPVLSYEVYRRDKPTPSAAAANDGAWRAPGTKRTPGWEYVGAVPAQLKGEYFLGAPTVGDSTIALGQYYSTFFVRATTATPSVFFDSPVDSGYSVDNIAPPAPASFAYSVGNLSWLASTADDFDYFSVYGSATSTFNASAVLIGHTIGTGYNVNANNYPHYFVTATDFSGNEGKPAHVNKSTGVNDSPRYALAVNAYPNPFNPLTTIRYDVPSAGNVVVSVYDASGALLTTLVNGARAPGSYSVRWDGRNAAGNPASSGVYFVKLSVNGQTTTRKVALVK